MRAVIQRVCKAQVSVDDQTIASIGDGLVILLGIENEDTREKADQLCRKIAALRIFSDAEEKMNLSVRDINGSAIVVSQFTLMADTRKGNRPSFFKAAPPDMASPMVDYFIEALEKEGVPTQSGQFAAHMLVEIHNSGPVTILMEA
ncbi:MAG: D-aminoacyl-tRNA deacylase [Chloroflexota bacterium]|nr:D-aminoacyl-tRNA deacylase [Chloroflexota bacterium]